jgi:hypothetical protein
MSSIHWAELTFNLQEAREPMAALIAEAEAGTAKDQLIEAEEKLEAAIAAVTNAFLEIGNYASR